MRIEIDGYLLESDEHGYITSKIYIKGESSKFCGEKHYKHKRFYGTLAGAVKGLIDCKIKLSNATTLKELVVEINSHRKIIESAIGL